MAQDHKEDTLRIVQQASTSGNHVNEDIAGHAAQTVWALDGATGLGDEPVVDVESDARWFVQRISAALTARSKQRPTEQLTELLRRVMISVREEFRHRQMREIRHDFEYPSAGLAICRSFEERIDLAVLGDCKIIYRTVDGQIGTVASHDLERLDNDALALLRRFKSDGERGGHDARQLLTPVLRLNRSKMNKPGGYWIVGLDPAAADHLVVRSFRPGELDTAILGTDGFFRISDLFEARSLRELLHNPYSLSEVIAELRDIESEDPECDRFIRFKRSDDATAVSVRFF